MFDKIKRYWRAFLFLVRASEYVFYAIEQECHHQQEHHKSLEDDRQYILERQKFQFAHQNFVDVKAGLWDERLNWFYHEMK